METTRVNQAYRAAERLYMAMELSARSWVLLFSAGGTKERLISVAAGDVDSVQSQILLTKKKLALAADVPVASCYEAGRDGFWIHRWLLSIGVDNRVVDPASIEVQQRAKRLKTDRIDVHKLMKLLVRRCNGERDAWHEVRVPSAEQEDRRRLHRERERLMKELNALGNRIGSLLAAQGVRLPLGPDFGKRIEQVRCWDGMPLGPQLLDEIGRMWKRRELLAEQLHEVHKQQSRELADAQDEHTAPMRQLALLRGLGLQTPWVLCSEIFSWRQVENRRQIGALAGLTPTPYSSGESQREQGISKAGISQVRRVSVELAWSWLRLQPESALSQWFMRRFGGGSKRSRRIGIVALARKLLVALWRFLHDGIIPPGALLKRA